MKRVLINVEDRELRVAIMEDDQLVEFYSESLDERSILNNIYRGRIEGILPGLNAAFVNVGLERNAFLHFEDVRPDVIMAKAGIARPARRDAAFDEEAGAEPARVELAADQVYEASEEELEAAREIAAELEDSARAGDLERLDGEAGPVAREGTGGDDEEDFGGDDSEEGESGAVRGDREESGVEEGGRGRRRRRRGRRGGRRREFGEPDGREPAAQRLDAGDDEDGADDDVAEAYGDEPASALARDGYGADSEDEEDSEAAELAAERFDRPERGRFRRNRRERTGEQGGGQFEPREREPEVRLFFDPRLAKRVDRRGGKPEDWANHRGYEPPSGYAIDWVIPDDDADAGTRAAVNPFEGVFTPGASMSKRWKIMALKRTRNQADGQEVFFGVHRPEDPDAAIHRDSQEALFGAVRVKYDENGEPIPVSGPTVIGGVKYDGPRQNKFNKFKKKRKRKGRHMKRNDRSYFAVRRKKGDDVEAEMPAPEAIDAPEAKPVRKRATKAKTVEPEPLPPVEEAVEAKPVKKRAVKAKPADTAVTPGAEEPAVEGDVEKESPKPARKRATKAKAAEADAAAEAPAAGPAAGPVDGAVEEPAAAKPVRKRAAKAKPAELAVEPMEEIAALSEEPASDAAVIEEPARGRSKTARLIKGRGTKASPKAEPLVPTDTDTEPEGGMDQGDFLGAESAEEPAAEAGEPADDGIEEAEGAGGGRRRRRGRRGGRKLRAGEVATGAEQEGAVVEGEGAGLDGDSPVQAANADPAVSAEGVADGGSERPAFKSRRERERERRERRKELRWNRGGEHPAGESTAAPREERPAREARPGRDDRRDRKDRRDYSEPRAPRVKLPSFIETFKKGDEIMVQVIKEEIGTKGARITTFASLPGRYLVLLPYPNEEGGVSRKVEDLAERRRLKKLLRDISGDDYGFIIRTAGIEKDEEEIKKDAEFLIEEWRAIQEQYERSKAAELVASDQDILYKLCRDVFDESIGEIIIDDADQGEHLRNILGRMIPGLVDRVKIHTEAENLFVKHGVDKHLAKAARRKVWLKSGGYIIIDEAEALTAIDVNTGKFVGKDDQEKMILKTNLEAARTIARELKLRDIGGLIVVDFIDMKDHRNREQVQQEFRACLKKDRSKTQVSNISEFGLIEMTRKRVRRSLRKTLFTDCPYCQGAGVILSERQIWLHIKHEIVRVLEASQGQTETLTVILNSKIKQHIEATYRDSVARLEKRYNCRLAFSPTDLLHMENFRFERAVRTVAARPESE